MSERPGERWPERPAAEQQERRATTTTTTDVVVIGGGPTGENVADRVVRGGLEAILVEGALVGGECSYAACMPSKALLRGPGAVDEARRVDGARQAVCRPVDAEATLRRRTSFTSGWKDDGQVAWLGSAGIGLVRGHGRLAGERAVEVTTPDGAVQRLDARHAVVLATGTTPNVPPIPGLREAAPWTNREATAAEGAPRRLVVLGGGPVGCELALAWRELGSEQVTLVQRDPYVLSRLDPFAGEAVARGLADAGVEVLTGTQARRVERPVPGGPVRVELVPAASPGAGAATVVEADEVLVALGRAPATGDLGLETVGLEAGAPVPAADDGRVTGVDGSWLYAAGDVTGAVLLTHMGKYQGRACGDAIAARAGGELDGEPPPWSKWAATAQHDAVPQVVFTRPEVGAVGLTEAEARRRGLPVRVATVDIGAVAGASLHADGYAGTAQLVVDGERGVVVGATLVGPEVGELIHAATVAVVGAVPLDRLWHAVPSYPTVSELWLRLLEALDL